MEEQVNLFGEIIIPPPPKEKELPYKNPSPLIRHSHCPKCCAKMEMKKEGNFYYFEHCNRVWNASDACSDCENDDDIHDIFCKFYKW